MRIPNKLLLITTIQLIDEYFNLRTRVTEQKKKLEKVICVRFLAPSDFF